MQKKKENRKRKSQDNNIFDYLVKLNKKCDFPSSIYIEKFFTSLAFKYNLEITNKKKHCMGVLENFNNLFYKINSYFGLSEDFAFRYIKEIYFRKKNWLIRFVERPDCFKRELSNETKSIERIFFKGLRKFRYLYFIYYKNYTNYSNYYSVDDYETLKFFLKNLSEDDVMNIFKIRYHSSRVIDDEDMIKLIETITDKLRKIPGVKIVEHKIESKNLNMVKLFMNKIDKYKLKYKVSDIYDINDSIEYLTPVMMQIASCYIKYNNYTFYVKFVESDSKLYYCINCENNIVEKEVVYRMVDFDRIFLFITNDYISK